MQHDLDTIVRTVEECGGNKAEAARRLGVSRTHVWRACREHKAKIAASDYDGTQQHWEARQDDATLHIPKTEIRTVEDAIRHGEVDMTVWKLDRHSITAWESPNKDGEHKRLWNIRLYFKRREQRDPARFKEDMLAFLKSYAPKPIKPPRKSKQGELMLELSVPDIHFGKRADYDETGEEYNTQIAQRLYTGAVHHIVEEAFRCYKIGSIMHPVGNDIMHYSGMTYATTSGTRQDYCDLWRPTFVKSWETAADTIEYMARHAPVHVYVVEDNHANAESFYIGEVLRARYAHKDWRGRIEVDNRFNQFKFHRHGNVLIGLHHGHKATPTRLEHTMAKLRPRDFAECSVKEWHLGHLHKEHREREKMEDTFGAMVHRRLPSLSGTDSWHAAEGYWSPKAAIGLIWSPTALVGTIRYTPSPEEYRP